MFLLILISFLFEHYVVSDYLAKERHHTRFRHRVCVCQR